MACLIVVHSQHADVGWDFGNHAKSFCAMFLSDYVSGFDRLEHEHDHNFSGPAKTRNWAAEKLVLNH